MRLKKELSYITNSLLKTPMTSPKSSRKKFDGEGNKMNLEEILEKHKKWLNDNEEQECADLRGADLSGADLSGANLSGANLREAELENIKVNANTSGYHLVCPEKGSFIGFKKVFNYIIELEIPSGAKRSSATSRKCRCEYAKVLSITNIDGTDSGLTSITNNNYDITLYKVGEMVYPNSFDEDRWNECSNGIHFFITRQEAVYY